MAIQLVTVNGNISDFVGAPKGRVSIKVPYVLKDEQGNIVYTPKTFSADLDPSGNFSILNVPASDSPNIVPQGWAHEVEVNAGQWSQKFRTVIQYDANPIPFASLVRLDDPPLPTGDYATLAQLLAEAIARQQGDQGLANAISAEALARQQADTNLAGLIATEALIRQQDDTALSNALTNSINNLATVYLALTGGTLSGSLAVTGEQVIQDLISGATKRYRLRATGGALDFEGAGQSLFFSVWSNADFTGTQRTYLVLEDGSNTAQVVNDWAWKTAPFAPTIHFISANNGIGFFGATPVTTPPTVTGSIGGNTALQSLISQLASYGLIVDGTS